MSSEEQFNKLPNVTPKILVVDDDQSLSLALRQNLELSGFKCITASSPAQALSLLEKEQFNFLVVDHQMPGASGIEFIGLCARKYPSVSSILMTGFGSSDLALDAISKGASDYISKPFSNDDLVLLLNKIKARALVLNSEQSLPAETNKSSSITGFESIVASSPVMLEIFSTAKRLANFNTTVLIQGESGTGKELLARALHFNSSRKLKPFVPINCGAIPENLIESELFGHKKGAFTDAVRDKIGLFEEASGGTVFLDEIGELPLNLQVKLLRVLQEQQIQPVGEEKPKKIDVRIIAATLRNLEADVKTGRFREDLFFRLNVVTLDMPPLRERAEDIQPLVHFFIKKINSKLGTSVNLIEPEALARLISYEWRGNVRELENCIERAIVLSDNNLITLGNLKPDIQGSANKPENSLFELSSLSIKQHTEKIERLLIAKALDKTHGNRTQAAKLLEISHRALLYKLKEYELSDYGKDG